MTSVDDVIRAVGSLAGVEIAVAAVIDSADGLETGWVRLAPAEDRPRFSIIVPASEETARQLGLYPHGEPDSDGVWWNYDFPERFGPDPAWEPYWTATSSYDDVVLHWMTKERELDASWRALDRALASVRG